MGDAVAATSASSFALSKGRGKGHRLLALTFGVIANADTFDTGLDHIDCVTCMVIAAQSASEDLTVASAPSAGTIAFGATADANAIDAAYVTVIGSVRGHA